MISQITSWILNIIKEHFVLGVILGVLIESVIVPIPSPLVLMTAGFVLGEVYPSMSLGAALMKIILLITIPASIASIIGSYLVYGVAYFGGEPVIKRFKNWLGVEWQDILKIKKRVGSRQNVFVMLFRALPIMPLSLVSGVAGLLKMNWKPYTIFSFLGVVPRCFILAFLGWQFNTVYVHIAQSIEGVENLLTYLIIALVIAYILLKKFKIVDKVRDRLLG